MHGCAHLLCWPTGGVLLPLLPACSQVSLAFSKHMQHTSAATATAAADTNRLLLLPRQVCCCW